MLTLAAVSGFLVDYLTVDEHRAADPVTLPESPADPAAVPNPDRTTPAGLRWVAPPEERPILIGHNYPEVRPVLDIGVDRFRAHARHGFAVGRAEFALDVAAVRFALSADLRRAQVGRAALTLAAVALDDALAAYAKES